MNPMQQIKVEKISLNIGTGGPGVELEKALKLLAKITNKKPVETKTKKRIPTWGLRPDLAIGARVTLRGKEAVELLKRLFRAIDDEIPASKFDNEGNFAFGVPEYINVPGVTYDAALGIIGFEVAVTLQRPGFRIKRRKIKQKKIPKKHRITKDQALEFVKKEFGVNIGE